MTKRAAMLARSVTNEVVTNRAGIAPFFSSLTWISVHVTLCLSLGCVWVCVPACVRECVRTSKRERERERQRERKRKRERERERERESQRERGLID